MSLNSLDLLQLICGTALAPTGNQPWARQLSPAGPFSDLGLFHADAAKLRAVILPRPAPQVRSQALLFIKRMYEKEQLREYVEKFALNYLQLLVHPNPPSVLFGADKDTGLAQVLQRCSELGDSLLGEPNPRQKPGVIQLQTSALSAPTSRPDS